MAEFIIGTAVFAALVVAIWLIARHSKKAQEPVQEPDKCGCPEDQEASKPEPLPPD
jgi:hypothetical protein